MQCPVWEACTKYVLFLWTCLQFTLVSLCAGVFAKLWNSALLVRNYFLFFSWCFCPCGDCRELVFTVALVGARATLPL